MPKLSSGESSFFNALHLYARLIEWETRVTYLISWLVLCSRCCLSTPVLWRASTYERPPETILAEPTKTTVWAAVDKFSILPVEIGVQYAFMGNVDEFIAFPSRICPAAALVIPITRVSKARFFFCLWQKHDSYHENRLANLQAFRRKDPWLSPGGCRRC